MVDGGELKIVDMLSQALSTCRQRIVALLVCDLIGLRAAQPVV
jgi:hypothetical protein